MANVPQLILNNGRSMPIIGLGTSQRAQKGPADIGEAVDKAVKAGYRHFDCALLYENEEDVGNALNSLIAQKYVTREELFVTTKLPPQYNAPALIREALRISLAKLKMDYVDMYLIHSPVSVNREHLKAIGEDKMAEKPDHPEAFFNNVDHSEVWKEMEALVDDGLVKSIGLSNFNKNQIQHILDNARIKPANLQIECHAYFPQNDLVSFCQKAGIAVTAFAPIASPGLSKIRQDRPLLLNESVLRKIGAKYNKTPAQVLLRWLIQRNIGVLPKAVKNKRVQDNINVFDFTLDQSDFSEIDELGKNNLRFFPFEQWKEAPNFPFADVV